jgi:MFS family permease
MTALWYIPWAAGGLILASTSGFLMRLVPGKILLIFCGVSQLVAVLLFALMPEKPNYWAFVFPAMIAETACVDILYTVSNVFITTNLPSDQQGFAGALINCTLFLGICFFLGIAELAVGRMNHLGLSGSYRVAFWICTSFAAVALVVFVFLDIGSAKSDLTRDEKTRIEMVTASDSVEDEGCPEVKI